MPGYPKQERRAHLRHLLRKCLQRSPAAGLCRGRLRRARRKPSKSGACQFSVESMVAIYHFSTQSIGGGRSAVAAAAYRAGARLEDRNTGDVHDYRRRGGIIHEDSAVLLPTATPSWAQDRQILWNAAQDAERNKDGTMRKNARVAREWEVSLPHELTREQRRTLGHEFAREVVSRYGVAAQLDFHAPGTKGDNRNWHIHVQATSRELGRDGFGRKAQFDRADRDLKIEGLPNGKAQLSDLRKTWGEMANRALERAGHEERIDHRSLANQRDAARVAGHDEKARELDRLPTRHMGPAATSIERGKPLYRFGCEVEGEFRKQPSRTEIGDVNRRIELASEVGKIQREKESAGRSIIDTETTIGDALKQRDGPREQSPSRVREDVRSLSAMRPHPKLGAINHGDNSAAPTAKERDGFAHHENANRRAPEHTREEPRIVSDLGSQSKSRANLSEQFGHLITGRTRHDATTPSLKRNGDEGVRNASGAADMPEPGAGDRPSLAQRAERQPPVARSPQLLEQAEEKTRLPTEQQAQQNRLQLLAIKVEQQREERERQRREHERSSHTR